MTCEIEQSEWRPHWHLMSSLSEVHELHGISEEKHVVTLMQKLCGQFLLPKPQFSFYQGHLGTVFPWKLGIFFEFFTTSDISWIVTCGYFIR